MWTKSNPKLYSLPGLTVEELFISSVVQFSSAKVDWLILFLAADGIGVMIFIASRQTLQKLSEHKSAMIDEKVIKEKFNSYDKNSDGSLDPKELALLCNDLGSPLGYNQLEAAILILDKNDDGKIQYSEFLEWWLKKD